MVQMLFKKFESCERSEITIVNISSISSFMDCQCIEILLFNLCRIHSLRIEDTTRHSLPKTAGKYIVNARIIFTNNFTCIVVFKTIKVKQWIIYKFYLCYYKKHGV